jgi:phosphoglycolate phosphatase
VAKERGEILSMQQKSLLLFDLDGTLIDSVPDLSLAINLMLEELGKDSFSIDQIKKWVGNGALMLVQRAMSGKNEPDILNKEELQKALELFLDHYTNNIFKKTRLYPNVKETLQELHKYSKKMVIITNKPHKFVKPILEELKIEEFFDDFIGGDYLSQKKPHPLPINYIIEKFQIPKRDVVMIGDSKSDILAAKSANIDSIALSYGYNQNEDLSKFKPELIIDNFSKLKEILL